LGFNLFSYLGKAADVTATQVGPAAAAVGQGVGKTVNQTVNVGAIGTKKLTDVAAGTVTGGIDLLQRGLNHAAGKNAAITHAMASKNKPEPDETGSSSQGRRGKAGFCYVGKESNIRSCVKVTQADTCMSGDIFPTKELCVHPKLRL
jgi:hypothetical protein